LRCISSSDAISARIAATCLLFSSAESFSSPWTFIRALLASSTRIGISWLLDEGWNVDHTRLPRMPFAVLTSSSDPMRP
jgi:hypothetical protein